ncbi:MAG: endonuclease domain-containing protein [Sphingobacteriales bacterium]
MANKIIKYNPILKEYARKLRKQSTLSEVLLWIQIKKKSLGVEFHRQVPIDNYVVDFYCHELMLAIEIDGKSHEIDTVFENDIKRQKRLEELGVKFIRFNDLTVKKNMTGVLDTLAEEIKKLQAK